MPKQLTSMTWNYNTIRKFSFSEQLCLDFSKIFYSGGDHLAFTNEIKHLIDTKDATPSIHKIVKFTKRNSEQRFKKCLNRVSSAHLALPGFLLCMLNLKS